MSQPGTVLAGRRAESAALDRLLEQTIAGEGGSLLLTGAAGVGKSHLVAVGVRRAEALGLASAVGRCRESVGAPPLWPWRQLARRLGLPPLGETGNRFTRFERMQETLASAAETRPMLLVLEDVHRADESSLRMLQFLADVLWPAPIGLLVTCRVAELGPVATESVHSLGAAGRSRHLALVDLDAGAVAEWLLAVGVPTVPGAVHDRTGGNPLLVQELIAVLQDGGDVEALPASVPQLVERRLAGLDPPTRHAVRVAAVLGRDFDMAPLAVALEVGPQAALALLEPAVAAGVVRRDPGRPGGYRFAHALVRDAVHATLTETESALLHERALVALHDTGWPVASDLAHHGLAARAVIGAGRARELSVAAAAEAEALAAWQDAATWWQRVELLGSSDPPSRLRWARSLLLAGRVEESRALFIAEADASVRAGAPGPAAQAALGVGETVAEVAGDTELVAVLDRVLGLSGIDPVERVRLEARRAIATYWMPGEQAASRARSLATVELATDLGDDRAMGAALVARQFTMRGPDLLEERIEAGAGVLAISTRTGDDDLRFRAHQWLVPDRVQAGDTAGAVADVHAMRAIAEARRDPLQRWWVNVYDALLADLGGRGSEAEQLTASQAALGRRLGQSAASAYRLGMLVKLRWRGADLAPLEPELRAAIAAFPGLATLKTDLCLVLASTGRGPEAAGLLGELTRGGTVRLPRDSLYLASVAILAEAAITCGVRRPADLLLAELTPYARRHLVQGVPVSWGAGAWHLARLHHHLGNGDEARRLARLADELHAQWGESSLGPALDGLAAPVDPLSPREREVLALLASGSTNQQIASALHVSVHTVERHVSNMFAKVDARNRAELTAWAHRRGLAV